MQDKLSSVEDTLKKSEEMLDCVDNKWSSETCAAAGIGYALLAIAKLMHAKQSPTSSGSSKLPVENSPNQSFL